MFDLVSPWQEVLDYWFEDGIERGWPSQPAMRKWFRAGAGDDAEIEHRFGSIVEAALQQELVDWERQPLSRLALILVLDQFPRHIFRRTPRAFSGDHRAATLAVEGLSRRMTANLPPCGQVFFVMPLMHAEDEDLHDLCVTSLEAIQQSAPAAVKGSIEGHLVAAREHRDIIRRFGRFPHRNKVLGRDSSDDERLFLETHSGYGQ
ncbi:DUF924 domain-containing protein [Alcanivorax profundi]|uniref:DUF924 domain-containing protein n=1 Tax=Alcanivorax profundi TaxID=2338368 RepID=A0A418Y3M4_9GAMM|nr:DUF924 family protein [Alcanivorax profundi]RJG20050.1 DUF924 domain-containing protein [Alcanivorax profundi]